MVRVVVLIIGLAALHGSARAQPAPQPPPDEEEIEMEPEQATAPAPTPTDATPVTKDPKAARKWLLAAQQLVQKGDYYTRHKRVDDARLQYENAATAFGKSLEAGDDLNTYYLLADVEDKLGKFDLAAGHCRTVVKATAGIRPDVLKKATAKLDELTTKIGVITLVVQPEGTAITMGGNELGKAPLADPLLLLPGTYAFAFAADGFQPKEIEIAVEPGSESERTIELEAIKIIVEPPKPPEPPPPPPPVVVAPSKLPLYIGAGATGALLVTATVTGILAVGKHGTYTANDSTPGERADAKSSGERLALISDLTLVGTLGAAGFTAYWYWYKYRRAQRKPAEQPRAPARVVPEVVHRGPAASHWSKVDVVPWVQTDASGLSIAGTF